MALSNDQANGRSEGHRIPIVDAAEEASQEASEELKAEIIEPDDELAQEVAADTATAQPGDAEEADGPAAAEQDAQPETDLDGDDIVSQAEALLEDIQDAVASEGTAAAASKGADSADELAKAQAQAQEWQSRYMRLHAEWDTYRRRMTDQRQEEKQRATEKLVTSLLPVLDDFECSIAFAQTNGETGLLEGVQAVSSKLIDTLIKNGVEVIDPAGQAFDALEAQAVATVENADVPDETVNEVYQKGYKMGKKVLRPAMVTITTGGPKRPKEQD